MSDTSPIKMVAIPEIARRAGACTMTVHRFVTKHDLQPDGLLVTTGNKPPTKLYVEPRAVQIEKQLAEAHKNIS